MIAIVWKSLKSIKFFIDKGADLSAENIDNKSVTELVTQQLKRLDADPLLSLLEEKIGFKTTSLHYYAKTENLLKIYSCLASGIHIDAQQPNSFTPLTTALMYSKLDAARLLVINKANLDPLLQGETGPKSLLEKKKGLHGQKGIRKCLDYGINIISGTNNERYFSTLPVELQKELKEYKKSLDKKTIGFGDDLTDQELRNEIFLFLEEAKWFWRLYHAVLQPILPANPEKTNIIEVLENKIKISNPNETFLEHYIGWKVGIFVLRTYKKLPEEIVRLILSVGLESIFQEYLHGFAIKSSQVNTISASFFSHITKLKEPWDSTDSNALNTRYTK